PCHTFYAAVFLPFALCSPLRPPTSTLFPYTTLFRSQMTSDGTTAGGCWIYAGVYSGGENMAARRRPRTDQDETAAEWAWAWPANRRILYNRASAAPDGTPWSERKKFVWWDEDAGKWTGKDVPDFPIDRAPAARSDQAY